MPTITLTTILGTNKGIQTLTQFLQKSRAFTRTGLKIQPSHAPTLEAEPKVESDKEIPYDPEGD